MQLNMATETDSHLNVEKKTNIHYFISKEIFFTRNGSFFF
jgi:hypothetical protein